MRRDVGQLVAVLDVAPEAVGEAFGELGVGEGIVEAHRHHDAIPAGGDVHLAGHLQADHVHSTTVELVAEVALGAADRIGAGAQDVVDVGIKADHLQAILAGGVEEAGLVADRGLLLSVVVAGAGRVEAAVHAGQQGQIVGGVVEHAQPRDGHEQVVLARAGGALATVGIVAAEVLAGQLDILQAQAGHEAEAAPGDLVLNVIGPGARGRHAVALAAGRVDGGQHQRAVLDAVILPVLQPVFLVLVIAHGHFQLVRHGPGVEAQTDDGLHAGTVVFARVVAQLDGVVRAVGVAAQAVQHLAAHGDGLVQADVHAAQARQGRLEGLRAVEQYGRPEAAVAEVQVVDLEPVAAEIVVVAHGGDVDGVVELDEMGGLHLPVAGVDVVQLGGGIAAERGGREVLVGQAQIGLVGIAVGVAELDLQRLIDGRFLAGVDAELDQIVLHVEAGVATAVQLLEAVGLRLEGLGHEAQMLGRAAHGGMHRQQVELADAGVDEAAERLGDRPADQIDGTAHRARAELDRAGAFAHLHRFQPAGGGEIVGGGGGIGGGRDQHAVLHQGDLLRPFHAGAAQADVGAQAEAVLLLDVDAGSHAQDAVDVLILEQLQLRVADVGGRAGDVVAGLLAADHHQTFDRQARRLDIDQGQRQAPIGISGVLLDVLLDVWDGLFGCGLSKHGGATDAGQQRRQQGEANGHGAFPYGAEIGSPFC